MGTVAAGVGAVGHDRVLERWPGSRHQGAKRIALVLAVGLIAVAATAAARQDKPRLAIEPQGKPGGYFDLTLDPGASTQLAVDLSNHGTQPVDARTFAADVYTIINGGFGAKLSTEPPSGPTTWLTYPTDVLTLPPGTTTTRTFTVHVPPDATPGEHITSLIIENAQPVPGSGSIALNQVLRAAVAVVIHVPGPDDARLEIGAGRHKAVAGRSVISIDVSNPGNVRLKPTGEFVLRDSSGKEITHVPVTMDSFYAGTSTQVEVPLATLLQPGTYTASLTLTDDAHHVSASKNDIPIVVSADEINAAKEAASPATVAPVNQSANDAGGGGTTGVSGAVIAAIAVAVAIVGAALVAVLASRRRRSPSGPEPRPGDGPDPGNGPDPDAGPDPDTVADTEPVDS